MFFLYFIKNIFIYKKNNNNLNYKQHDETNKNLANTNYSYEMR